MSYHLKHLLTFLQAFDQTVIVRLFIERAFVHVVNELPQIMEGNIFCLLELVAAIVFGGFVLECREDLN